MLISVSAAYFIVGRYRWLAVVMAVLGTIAVVLSRSGTSLLLLGAVYGLLPLAFVYRRGARLLSLTIGAQLVVFTLIATVVTFANLDIVKPLLEAVGKDSTLTGRTVLWDFAQRAVAERPVLGFGYGGFWHETNTAVPYLRYVVGQQLWFFHNVYRETAVSFGYPGLLLFLATMAVAFHRALSKFFQEPSAFAIFAVLYMVVISIYCSSENPLFANHSYYQLMLAVIFAATTQHKGNPHRLWRNRRLHAPAVTGQP
jgi:exopolysaccharide production protein ExoQ